MTTGTPQTSSTTRPGSGRGPGSFIAGRFHVLDNQYLLSLVEIGLVGVACLIAVFAVPMFLGRGLRRRSADDEVRNLGQMFAASSCAGRSWRQPRSMPCRFPPSPRLFAVTMGLSGAAWCVPDGGRSRAERRARHQRRRGHATTAHTSSATCSTPLARLSAVSRPRSSSSTMRRPTTPWSSSSVAATASSSERSTTGMRQVSTAALPAVPGAVRCSSSTLTSGCTPERCPHWPGPSSPERASSLLASSASMVNCTSRCAGSRHCSERSA